MRFLPIVERELRVASRRPATYWLRLGAAAVALVVGGWLMLLPPFQTPQLLGIALFIALSIVAFAYCTFAGVRTTSDCLSEEKREGTLGLLFLTDLKGYDVVLGKLVASSLHVFYGVLAIFPIMAIPLLIGGVSVEEFWRVVVTSLNNLFFSLSAGMLASAMSRDERRASGLCFSLVTFFVVILPVAGLAISESRNWPRPWPGFFIPSPGYAAVMSFDQMFTRIGFNYYYWSLLCIHLLSWTFLVLACLIVPRTWQEKARSVQGEKRQSFWRSLVHGPALTRLSLRQRMLSINPFYWLAGRERFPIFAVWGFLFCCAAFWTWGLLKYPHYWLDEIPYVWTALIVHTVLKIWIASEAGRRLTIDRRSGALELLLSTPMSVREILKGQILALRRQFLGPLLVVLCADVVFAIASHRDQDLNWIWTAGITMLIADVIVLPFVGMWAGLSARNTNRAAGTAIARIMVLPWIIWALFWTGIAFMSFGGRMSLGPELPVVSWMAIGFGVDLFFGLRAWHLLHGRFRAVVAGRFDARGRSLSFATTPAPAAPAAESVGGG